MKHPSRSLIAFVILLTGLTIVYWQGAASVPFHPDESTQLFTSSDVELFVRQPSALFWQPSQKSDPRQRYRELDAPFTRGLIGLARLVSASPALPVDWDWSKTWDQNQEAGALPSPALLLTGRMAAAALFPFSVLFLFLAVRRATNEFTAWGAALLLACNALVLLHTRRAMAEGALLFTTTLTLWSLVRAEKQPWVTALPAALAFCAKQTLAALAPIGLIAILWPPLPSERTKTSPWLHRIKQVVFYGGLMILVIGLLNPFLWQQPIPALQAAIKARGELAAAQTGDRPEQALNTPALKLIGMIGALYLTPPIFAETGNYLDNTRAAETAYLANPLHRMFRSIPAGGILFTINLFGFLVACVQVRRQEQGQKRRLVLLIAATVFQTLALLVLIPLPWQRYYLPAVPYACLWTAYGLDQLRVALTRASVRSQKTAAV